VRRGAKIPKQHGLHDREDILVLKLLCNKRSSYTERPTLLSLKKKPHFEHVQVMELIHILVMDFEENEAKNGCDVEG
jgi:hypothetical protein